MFIEETQKTRMEALVSELLTKAEQAIRELDAVTVTCKEKSRDTATGAEINREHQERLPDVKGPVDRNGLKQLTAVLKDIQDILGVDVAAAPIEVMLEETVHDYAQ